MTKYKDGYLEIEHSDDAVNAIKEQSHWLKTIAFNLSKIDQDLSDKRPYRLHIKRGKRK